MATTYTSPSVGLNADTGGVIEGWPHVLQCLQNVFTTNFGDRVMREWYGSFVTSILGRNMTPSEITSWFAAISTAVEQWEPRYRVTGFDVSDATRDGALSFTIEGEYRPRALLGDFTVEGTRRVAVLSDTSGVVISDR